MDYWFEHDGRLPGTAALTMRGDFAAQMVSGIDAFAELQIRHSSKHRARLWRRDLSSHEAYSRSIAENRCRFRQIIGVTDSREPVRMQRSVAAPGAAGVGEASGRGTCSCAVHRVAWNVFRNVTGEGWLLEPQKVVANVVALPDCDHTPEMIAGLTDGVPAEAQFARRLAERGYRVLVPTLIDRRDTHSGVPGIRMTNQPHREFIYRAAFELGRHVIGYEVQKVLSAVDWFRHGSGASDKLPVGLIGHGEGGLIAFYAAAADPRIDATAVCGYFMPRDTVWAEPIYRNVFRLLDEFGDAEVSSLIAPRGLVVEACAHPRVDGPPLPGVGRTGAAPGKIATPPVSAVRSEFDRATCLIAGLDPAPALSLCVSGAGDGLPGSDSTLAALQSALGLAPQPTRRLSLACLPDASTGIGSRSARQVRELVGDTQYLLHEAERRREEYWSSADDSDLQAWRRSCERFRARLWDDVIGRLPEATVAADPRSRCCYDEPAFRGYELTLGVYPGVPAYGILLIPKEIHPGEKRPVVVCQHGLEGTCQVVVERREDDAAYHRFAARLAERGFVVYAPQNPYIGGDRFRVLQRKLNPLGKSLFSVIVRQHEAALKWLAAQPFVDPARIGFYGISYGGKTAVRVPALLQQYCLSICSADFNEWIWKNASGRHRYSYLLTGEYEMPEFDLGNTFNYAELSWLILPRPFMVERGHHDGVAPDRWVAYEYAKTLRRYSLLGLRQSTEMEVFDGPHTIHGKGTFEFLHRHLGWPEPPGRSEASCQP